MKLAIYSIVALLGIGLVYCDESSNKFVDQLIDALQKRKNFDPLHIKDHRSQFDKKIGLIEVKGELDMRQTVVYGLSHIQRNGNAKVDDKDDGFSAKMLLGGNKLKVDSELTVVLGKLIHPNLKMEATIGNIDIQFATDIDADGKFKLKEFVIDELKDVQIKVHGLSILDPLIDIVSDAFLVFFNKEARESITETVEPIVAAELRNMSPKI